MKKTISIILMLCTALFVQMLNLHKACSAVLLDRVVASVNDEVITWSELINMINIEGKTYLGDVSEEEKKQRIKELEKPFLNKLIGMKLQIQEAGKMGLTVSDSEIDSAVYEIQEKFDLTDEALMTSLKAEGMTLKDYRARLREQILMSKVANFAIKSNIVITDREIQEYYEANRETYSGKEKLRIRQIFFAAPEDDSQKAAIEAKAQEMIRKINKGEDFARLAIEFSEGPSRQFGGDLGYVSRGSALKEIDDVAFALKIGEVSKPFWSPAGLHIIKLEDKIEGGGIEKVREKIKETLFKKAFDLKYHKWSTGLREKAYVEIKL